MLISNGHVNLCDTGLWLIKSKYTPGQGKADQVFIDVATTQHYAPLEQLLYCDIVELWERPLFREIYPSLMMNLLFPLPMEEPSPDLEAMRNQLYATQDTLAQVNFLHTYWINVLKYSSSSNSIVYDSLKISTEDSVLIISRVFMW